MPEYFFHVALELLHESSHGLADPRNNFSISNKSHNLSPFLQTPKRSTSLEVPSDISPKIPSSRRHRTEEESCSRPSIAEQTIRADAGDHRLDEIFIEGTDMMSKKHTTLTEQPVANASSLVSKGIGTPVAGVQTKGRYIPLDQDTTNPGWGIVHLYRDVDETPGLYDSSPLSGADLWFDGAHKKHQGKPHPPPRDEECTTLCILAVPSYFTPADFLAFVGEETRDQVSHFRMIRTSRANRYMVLMKFRNGKRARQWQNEWNGKVFNSMEPETCHVVFLKSVEIIHSTTESTTSTDTTYPRTPNDPLLSSSTVIDSNLSPQVSTTASAAVATKPLPPPTPSLIELPTCPVCLERMDETTGLLTILCQHVFHCTCLQKWSGGGCPVCRYTHDDFSSRLGSSGKYKSKKHFLSKTGEYEIEDYEDVPIECETCHTQGSLWQCLICGKVGCGRYEGKHAFAHFEESGHSFSMDLDSKRVWDYSSDGYVHRIIQDNTTGGGGVEKLVELPGRGARSGEVLDGRREEDEWGVKMENVALEYTHLLTSQLESQRAYFEEVVERAVDKASEATRKVTETESRFEKMSLELRDLRVQHAELRDQILPPLERDRDRAVKRGEKFETLSREMERRWQQEKTMVQNLMERIKFLEESDTKARARVQELEEENRDLMLNFSMGEKIRGLAAEQDNEEGQEIVEGTLEVPLQTEGTGRKKNKGKGRR